MNIEVRHDAGHRRFETEIGGRVAYLSYACQGGAVVFDHTFVPPEFRGKGVASALVRAGLEEARRQQWKIMPSCSYVASFIERHSEFADLLAARG